MEPRRRASPTPYVPWLAVYTLQGKKCGGICNNTTPGLHRMSCFPPDGRRVAATQIVPQTVPLFCTFVGAKRCVSRIGCTCRTGATRPSVRVALRFCSLNLWPAFSGTRPALNKVAIVVPYLSQTPSLPGSPPPPYRKSRKEKVPFGNVVSGSGCALFLLHQLVPQPSPHLGAPLAIYIYMNSHRRRHELYHRGEPYYIFFLKPLHLRSSTLTLSHPKPDFEESMKVQTSWPRYTWKTQMVCSRR